jgi:hypothetical protein
VEGSRTPRRLDGARETRGRRHLLVPTGLAALPLPCSPPRHGGPTAAWRSGQQCCSGSAGAGKVFRPRAVSRAGKGRQRGYACGRINALPALIRPAAIHSRIALVLPMLQLASVRFLIMSWKELGWITMVGSRFSPTIGRVKQS